MSDDFDLQTKRLVWIEVTWDALESRGDELAEVVQRTIELQVELVDLDEFGRLFISPLDDDGNPRPGAVPEATPERIAEWQKMNDTDRALAVVKDWRRVRSGGKVVPYSDEGMRHMMRIPNFPPALFLNAYPRAYAGMKDTRRGNSKSSPADGQASDASEA